MNDFWITAFPMRADGTPDLANIVFEPSQAQWNVPATWKVKGTASLEGPWVEVQVGGNTAYRFVAVAVAQERDPPGGFGKTKSAFTKPSFTKRRITRRGGQLGCFQHPRCAS